MRNGSPARGAAFAAGEGPDGSARQGLSLLVAEDSAAIRRVFQTYLEGSPHTATFATDGREALQLFRARRFDLVLMDMQMPVMDGLVATRAMRAFESEEAHTPIPIVACTASARPEDIDASRLAGCNDHLLKPFEKPALLALLNRLTNRRSSETRDGSNRVPSPINVEVPAGLASFAPAYLEARRRDVTAATGLLDTGDFAQLGHIAHKMAGSGGLYGFQGLTELATRLEASARAADRAAIEEHLQALRVYLTRVRLPPDAAIHD